MTFSGPSYSYWVPRKRSLKSSRPNKATHWSRRKDGTLYLRDGPTHNRLKKKAKNRACNPGAPVF
jgi:hypothetical protein